MPKEPKMGGRRKAVLAMTAALFTISFVIVPLLVVLKDSLNTAVKEGVDSGFENGRVAAESKSLNQDALWINTEGGKIWRYPDEENQIVCYIYVNNSRHFSCVPMPK